MPKLIKLKEVIAKTSICRTSIYSKIAEGKFPKPVKLGARASAWLESEIDQWINDRLSERDNS